MNQVNDVTIVPVAPAYHDAAASLVAALLKEIEERMHTHYFNAKASEISARMPHLLKTGRYHVLCAMHTTEGVVGIVTMYESHALYADGAFGTLAELYVLPQWRSNGIGKALLNAAKAYGETHGWGRFEVTTPPLEGFGRSLNFYLGNGFSLSGGRKLALTLSSHKQRNESQEAFSDRQTQALLLIDIQQDYFCGGAHKVPGAEAALEQAKVLLRVARASAIPVYHIRHLSVRPGATFFLPGSVGSEFHPDLSPLPQEVCIVKHHPNSFKATELENQLNAAGISTLIVAGMMSQMCIDATVRAASDLGYRCIVAHDACAAKAVTFGQTTVSSEQVHAGIMGALKSTYATVAKSEEIIKKEIKSQHPVALS